MHIDDLFLSVDLDQGGSEKTDVIESADPLRWVFWKEKTKQKRKRQQRKTKKKNYVQINKLLKLLLIILYKQILHNIKNIYTNNLINK